MDVRSPKLVSTLHHQRSMAYQAICMFLCIITFSDTYCAFSAAYFFLYFFIFPKVTLKNVFFIAFCHLLEVFVVQ